MVTQAKALPPVPIDIAFDPGDKLIHGTILRWDAEQGWRDRDGLDPGPVNLIVVATTAAIQRFKDKRCVETIMKAPLPDVNKLNASVPVAEWEPDMTGKPRPPYQLFRVVYLLNPTTAEMYTYLNSTAGAAIGVERLESQIRNMRMLRGAHVCPVVTLGEAPFKTSFGMKTRPGFGVVNWYTLGRGPNYVEDPAAVPQIAAPATAPTVAPAQPAESEPKVRGRKAKARTSDPDDPIGF
jgi:hypothetical protein